MSLYLFLQQQGLFSGRDDVDGLAGIPVGEVAEQLGYTPGEVIRLVEELATCGQQDYTLIPLFMDDSGPREERMIWSTSYGAMKHPLRLTAPERAALVSVLTLAGVDDDDELVAELSKTAPAEEGGPGLGLEISTGIPDEQEALCLQVIASALSAHHLMEFDYLKPGESVAKRRRVEPQSLSYENGRLYLNAFCLVADGGRMFSLERMSDPVETEMTFEPREMAVRRFVDRLSDEFPQATLRVAPGVVMEPRDWPGITFEEAAGRADAEDGRTVEEGWRIAHIAWAGSDWLPVQVASRLGLVEAVAPAGLVERTAQVARRRLEAADASLARWRDAGGTI